MNGELARTIEVAQEVFRADLGSAVGIGRVVEGAVLGHAVREVEAVHHDTRQVHEGARAGIAGGERRPTGRLGVDAVEVTPVTGLRDDGRGVDDDVRARDESPQVDRACDIARQVLHARVGVGRQRI